MPEKRSVVSLDVKNVPTEVIVEASSLMDLKDVTRAEFSSSIKTKGFSLREGQVIDKENHIQRFGLIYPPYGEIGYIHVKDA